MLVSSNYLRRGSYLPPVFKKAELSYIRPRRSFRCRSTPPCGRSFIRALVVLVAVQLSVPGLYLPPVLKRFGQFHPRRSFRCRSRPPCGRIRAGRVAGVRSCPTIGARIVSPAGVKLAECQWIRPRRSFRCRSKLPCGRIVQRSIRRAGRCPAIGAGIVSAAGVEEGNTVLISTPDDHFTASPHCRVKPSSGRSVGGACRGPAIRAGLVSAARV